MRFVHCGALASALFVFATSKALADEHPTPAPLNRSASADISTCPKPEWPRDARRKATTGVSTVGILISDTGTVLDSVIKKSSGFYLLDQASVSAMRRCKFSPALRNGVPVNEWMLTDYRWTLAGSQEEIWAAWLKAQENLKAGKEGNLEALYQLALYFKGGAGMPSDTQNAFTMMRHAASRGHVKAEFELGDMLNAGAGTSRNEKQALEWYLKAAEHGDDRAQVKIAHFHVQGRGVPRDAARAVALYQKAAEQGNIEALESLGRMYAQGLGVEQHVGQAAVLYGRAADGGNVMAGVALARLQLAGHDVGIDEPLALALVRHAADRRETEAEFLLGSTYLSDKHTGVDKKIEGMSYLRRAATGGHFGAMYLLAQVLMNKGTDAEVKEGLVWLGKAAIDLPAAQFRLSQTYENGKGVAPDAPSALKWLQKAALAGSRDAMLRLATAYQKGELGLPVNVPLAEQWRGNAARLPAP